MAGQRGAISLVSGGARSLAGTSRGMWLTGVDRRIALEESVDSALAQAADVT